MDGKVQPPDDDASSTPPPAERHLNELLGALLARTVDGTLRWEPDDAHEDSFCVVGPGWLVATRTLDGDGMAPYPQSTDEPPLRAC